MSARLLGLAVVLALAGPVVAACGKDDPGCEAAEVRLSSASPEPADTARFQVDGPGWLAGDSAYSVPLPDGRVAWLFSDSFVGTLDADSRPQPGTRMVHNALVTETAAGTLQTSTSELFDEPHAFFPDPSASEYYWVQDGMVAPGVEGEELVVFLSRTREVEDDGFAWVGTAIARVSLPDLTLIDITETASTGDIAWGAALMEMGASTYVYGIRDRGGAGKDLYLAQAPTARLADRSRWRYWGDQGWTSADDQASALTDRVANELSVSPLRDGFLMISHETGEPFSPVINAWVSCSPEGPWTDPTPIYRTPESGRGQHFTYNAHAHPEISPTGRLLISYNVNTFDFAELNRDPTLYRPRFIALTTG